jgi:hypothetical protein
MNFDAAPRRILRGHAAFIITPQRQLVKFANTAGIIPMTAALF